MKLQQKKKRRAAVAGRLLLNLIVSIYKVAEQQCTCVVEVSICVYKSKDTSCLEASDEPIRVQWVWPEGQGP